MLKITRKVEYALIALRHMQSKDPKGLTSAKEIATHYGVPKQLLAKTLQQMASPTLHRKQQHHQVIPLKQLNHKLVNAFQVLQLQNQ